MNHTLNSLYVYSKQVIIASLLLVIYSVFIPPVVPESMQGMFESGANMAESHGCVAASMADCPGQLNSAHVPKLNIHRGLHQRRKRPRADTPVFDSRPTMSKKMALEMFATALNQHRNSDTAPPLTSELPSLSGTLVRAFVGRSIIKRREDY